MVAQADTVRIALLALLVGVALPLLVQLYVTLRSLRRTAETALRRLDRTLAELGELTADVRRRAAAPPGSPSLGAAVAAAAPVIIAAARAFRSSMNATETDHQTKEPTS